MKRTVKFFFICIGLGLAANMWAQGGKPKPAAQDDKNKEKQPRVYPKYPVFLGKSDISGGDVTVTKMEFDSLLKQGLTAKDSAGNPLKFHGFMFTYGERNLYEDSVGKLMILTDLLAEYCPGDTLTRNITNTIFERSKRGDTAYIDNVQLVDAEGNSKLGRSMRIIITK